jgi:hypothetical protein
MISEFAKFAALHSLRFSSSPALPFFLHSIIVKKIDGMHMMPDVLTHTSATLLKA